VFVRLAGIARRGAKPMVWGELFAGGIGGIVARSRPDLDAPPLQVRNAINMFLDELGEAPSRAAIGYDDVEDAGPLTASDADVSYLASVMTQLALDALVAATPSRFPNSAYLFGLQAAWDFVGPFDTRSIPTPGKLPAPPIPAEQDLLNAGKFVLSLIKSADAAT